MTMEGTTMPKSKTHKGTKKRMKVTATGKLVHRRPFGSHLLTKKSSKRKRQLRKSSTVGAQDKGRLSGLLGR